MGILETAQGRFTNAWVAVYRTKENIMYYGYGTTREEARAEVLKKIPENEIIIDDDVKTRETHRDYATRS